MKTTLLIVCFAVAMTVGCASSHTEASSKQHLTEAQALTIAKPMLPLPDGETYRVRFKDGTWEVWTDREGSHFRSWTVVVIQDADGKAQVVHRF